MLNSIGLQGPGIDAFLAARPALAAPSTAPGRSCRSPAAASSEYAELAARLRRRARGHAIEVNISCPNVEDRGLVVRLRPGAPPPR